MFSVKDIHSLPLTIHYRGHEWHIEYRGTKSQVKQYKKHHPKLSGIIRVAEMIPEKSRFYVLYVRRKK